MDDPTEKPPINSLILQRERSSQQDDLAKSAEYRISAILTKLTLHYWRPEMTSGQYAMLFEDYIDDLRGWNVNDIERACAAYRADPENKYFPRVGQILGILQESKAEPPCRLQTYLPPRPSGPRATKSVAEVLRENGFEQQARMWAGERNRD